MNRKTLRLLTYLRENSREKLTSISKKTGTPISTLFDLLKELNCSVIHKNTVLLNFAALGFHTRSYIILKVRKERREDLRKRLYTHPNVNAAYKINTGWDFVIETVHKNIKELDAFLEILERDFPIEDKQVHYLVDDVKREGFVVEQYA